MDGKAGFVFAFIQGWWYRTMVDVNIHNIEKACGDDTMMIKSYIKEKYGIEA